MNTDAEERVRTESPDEELAASEAVADDEERAPVEATDTGTSQAGESKPSSILEGWKAKAAILGVVLAGVAAAIGNVNDIVETVGSWVDAIAPGSPAVEQKTIPDVTMLSRHDAESEVANEGFKPVVTCMEADIEGFPSGLVWDTDPDVDTDAEVGSTIEIFVNPVCPPAFLEG